MPLQDAANLHPPVYLSATARRRGDRMRRRAFITLLGGAAAWPLAARAQQSDRMRRMGVLTNLAENDPEARARMEAFQQGLQQLGWTVGQNLQIDTRSTLGDAERTRKYGARPATSPAEFGKFIVDYTEKWGKVIRAEIAGVRPHRRGDR